MSPDYHATFVFGPNYIRAADGMREGGVPGIDAARDAEGLASAEQGTGAIVLAFAHDLPARWRSEDLNPWVQAVLVGTSMSMAELLNPDIRMIGNREGPSSLLMLHWNDVDSAHALRVARAIENSYAQLAS